MKPVPANCRLLFGPYLSPRCKVGRWLTCAIRGKMQVRAISAGPTSWPMTRHKRGAPFLIICGDLVKAIKRESELAVAYHWGVTAQTVWTWRKALGVAAMTEGSRQLWREAFKVRRTPELLRNLHAALKTPERGRKIAAALRGRARPREVMEKLRQANLGRRASAETRRRMSEAHKRLGHPRAWTRWEDDAVRQMSPPEAGADGRPPIDPSLPAMPTFPVVSIV